MERLQKSMAIYTRWLSRHCDALEDRSRSMPLAHLGRTMSAHAAELPDTEYSRRLAAMGNANEQLAELQKSTHFDKKELQQWYKGEHLQGTGQGCRRLGTPHPLNLVCI